MENLVRLLNALLMIVFPLAVGAVLIRRWRLSWRLYLAGMLTFIGSQVFHIPFNQLVLVPLVDNLGLIGSDGGVELLLFGLIFGLSAGVFEEGARYLVYRTWLKDVKRWEEAVLYGTGHGGIEAILLGGLALYAFFQATAYRNANLAEIVPPEQIELARMQIEAYWAAPWFAALLGAIERSLAMVIQVSLAVIVFQAVIRRNLIWLGLAVAWHTIVDAVALFGIQSWGVYITEGVLAFMALISLGMTLYLRPEQASEPEVESSKNDSIGSSRTKPLPPDLNLSDERLEDSRYQNGS